MPAFLSKLLFLGWAFTELSIIFVLCPVYMTNASTNLVFFKLLPLKRKLSILALDMIYPPFIILPLKLPMLLFSLSYISNEFYKYFNYSDIGN